MKCSGYASTVWCIDAKKIPKSHDFHSKKNYYTIHISNRPFILCILIALLDHFRRISIFGKHKCKLYETLEDNLAIIIYSNPSLPLFLITQQFLYKRPGRFDSMIVFAAEPFFPETTSLNTSYYRFKPQNISPKAQFYKRNNFLTL